MNCWHAPDTSNIRTVIILFLFCLLAVSTGHLLLHFIDISFSHSIHEFNMHWKADCDWSSTRYQQHKKYKKTKTNKRQYPLPSKSGLQVQGLCRQSKWNRKDYEGKDLWDRWILIPKRKAEGVIDGESKAGDCDEVICAVWGEPGGQWTEWGWRNEEGSWFHR